MERTGGANSKLTFLFDWTLQVNILFTPFHSAQITRKHVKAMTCEGLESGYKTPSYEHCGYTLIDGILVPETFFQRVIAELEGCTFEYSAVLTKAIIFERDFLESLDEYEDAVLMSVVLQLISRDKFPLNLWAACEQ